jgi:hypothetical protein
VRDVTICCDPSLELVTLAERIEQESRLGGPLSGLLEQFRERLRRADSSVAVEPDGIARLHTIVDQLARDVAGGHVRSISGLVAQTRCHLAPGRSVAAPPAA